MALEKVNIDFEDTVKFVWSWVAQVHSHLGVHGWTYPYDDSRKRGISISARNDIANCLFEMIKHTEQTKIFLEALNIQLNFLTTAKNEFHLPYHYFSFTKRGKEKNGQWDSVLFCRALEEDVQDLLNTFGYCSVLGEKHFVADTASKKKI